MYLNMYRGNFGNNPATMQTGSALIGYAVTNAEAYATAYSSQRRHEYTHRCTCGGASPATRCAWPINMGLKWR